MSPEPAQLRELLVKLVEADVRFILVGGAAVNAWGYLRGTHDLDIVPDPEPENLERLAEVLEGLGGKVKVQDGLLTANAIRIFLRAGDKTLVKTELGEVDVLQGLPQIPRFSELAARAEKADLEGVPVLVCSMEDLLTMKRAADRPMDRIDIEALQIAHSEESEEEKEGKEG